MKIGCPTEIKPQEYRVGMTPEAAQEAIVRGHEVLIQSGAGLGSGFADADYAAAGCRILPDAASVLIGPADTALARMPCGPRQKAR